VEPSAPYVIAEDMAGDNCLFWAATDWLLPVDKCIASDRSTQQPAAQILLPQVRVTQSGMSHGKYSDR
jgi:hypothetical protein